MLSKKFLALTAGAALLLFSPTAKAGVFTFTYNDIADALSGSGTFTTGDVSSPYLVTGISGIADGFTITGLMPPVGPSTPPFGNNNLLYYPGSPNFVDFSGIAFTTSGGPNFDLYFNNVEFTGYSKLQQPAIDSGFGLAAGTPISLTVSAVPEPASWVMMLLGFAAVGFAAYRRAKKTVYATS